MKPLPYESENFLGNQLRKLRISLGATQATVAKMLNVSRSTYSYYELGTTRPDPATLARLSQWYDVPIDFFFDEDLQLNTQLQDAEGRRRRTSRKGTIDPKQIGDLRPVERSLILLLRSNGVLDAQDVLDYLRDRLSDLEKEQE